MLLIVNVADEKSKFVCPSFPPDWWDINIGVCQSHFGCHVVTCLKILAFKQNFMYKYIGESFRLKSSANMALICK